MTPTIVYASPSRTIGRPIAALVAVPPELLAYQRFGCVRFGREPGAGDRRHAEHTLQSSRHDGAAHELRPLGRRHRKPVVGPEIGADTQPAITLLLDCGEIGGRQRCREILPPYANHEQPVGLRIRKRPEEYGIHDTVDRRRTADPERQRDDNREGKCRITPGDASRESQVGDSIFEKTAWTFVSNRLAGSIEAAHAQERPAPRLVARDAVGELPVDFACEMIPKLVLKLEIRASGTDRVLDPVAKAAEP
jgi:hypothetical protein